MCISVRLKRLRLVFGGFGLEVVCVRFGGLVWVGVRCRSRAGVRSVRFLFAFTMKAVVNWPLCRVAISVPGV